MSCIFLYRVKFVYLGCVIFMLIFFSLLVACSYHIGIIICVAVVLLPSLVGVEHYFFTLLNRNNAQWKILETKGFKQEWKSKLCWIARMCKGRYWKQMGSDKNEKQSWELNALIVCNKLLKYPKDVKFQLVVKLLLNLSKLCIVSPWFSFCNCKILMLIVEFNLLFANPKMFLCHPSVQPMLGDSLFIIQRYKNNNV